MGISNDQAITAILKTWYKDGVENLLFRNSPVLKKIEKTRVEGKTQNFAALYGRGGAVSSNFNTAKANALKASKNAEFSVQPGRLFSVYSMTAAEVQASVSKRGAYMKVAGNKMFAATEAFRKTLAAALYGRGYGEIGVTGSSYNFVTSTAIDITLSDDAIMKIDVGSELVFKSTIAASENASNYATVNSINGNTVNVTPSYTATVSSGSIVCIRGSQGNMPVGLDGWLPMVATRSGSTWTGYIDDDFFGVDRSTAADRLAGAFYLPASNSEKVSTAVQNLIRKLRRQGSEADMIIMNDADFAKLAAEIETTNTYFTATSTKEKKNASVGISEVSASFSTNYIENIIDDPYCPKGKFYVLDSKAVELWSYTNTDKVDDGIVDNNPGKQNVEAMDNEGKENSPYGLIFDDYLNVKSGDDSDDGPSTQVSLLFYGSFVVTNPSVCGVGLIPDSSYTGVLGYTL